MARASRIDDIIDLPGPTGGVQLNLTEGEHPLTATPSNEGLAFTGPDWKADLMAECRAAEARILADLKFLMVADAYRADPTMGTAFRNACKGKTKIIDLSSTSGSIVNG